MTDQLPPEGRIAGIDFGTVRIGVAVTDPERLIASPLDNYTRRGEDGDRRFFEQLVAQERIVGFVVGLPVHSSGDESAKSQEARRFGDWLRSFVELPVVYFDERLTSRFARDALQACQKEHGIEAHNAPSRHDHNCYQSRIAAR